MMALSTVEPQKVAQEPRTSGAGAVGDSSSTGPNEGQRVPEHGL
jgi:hypothetical protein